MNNTATDIITEIIEALRVQPLTKQALAEVLKVSVNSLHQPIRILEEDRRIERNRGRFQLIDD